jgi:hypothetical protein
MNGIKQVFIDAFGALFRIVPDLIFFLSLLEFAVYIIWREKE